MRRLSPELQDLIKTLRDVVEIETRRRVATVTAEQGALRLAPDELTSSLWREAALPQIVDAIRRAACHDRLVQFHGDAKRARASLRVSEATWRRITAGRGRRAHSGTRRTR